MVVAPCSRTALTVGKPPLVLIERGTDYGTDRMVDKKATRMNRLLYRQEVETGMIWGFGQRIEFVGLVCRVWRGLNKFSGGATAEKKISKP
jgi:hypothetical protein